jgi:hypothetical protein
MKKALLILGAFGALGFGLIAVAGAGAQEGEEGPVRNFIGRVAEKLGVSEDQLTTAVKDVKLEMIDEALADGRITEEQAAEMRERVENGKLRFPGGPGHRPDGERPHRARCLVAHNLVEMTARILGVEEQAVIDALKDGKSLAQIAEENGMGVDEYKAAVTEAVQAKLAAAAEAGRITRERADKMLANFTETLDRMINHVPDPDGPRPCRNHRPDDERPANEPTLEPEGTGL